ncbi:MAG: hypothetical protein DKM50_04775 [Candidatus Margulisiibacteriota bacterium]|nr:MAG: hypothetical protein DKM50_04775 [Candidatus Margulisiibacteriota bacterium]
MVLLSICIPSYNRPDELIRLLSSIDYFIDDIEIVICEDKSPRGAEVSKVVECFKKNSSLVIHYYSNPVNLGYDKNLQELISKANGKYITLMGDDDYFVSGAILDLISFLKNNPELGYVLRSYQLKSPNGIEQFRYYDSTIFFEPGYDSMIQQYRKNVFISGFTILREPALQCHTDIFDGTLLYQLYIAAETALKYKTAYYDRILTEQCEGGKPFFGNAEAEKDLYTPETITMNNSVNFMKGFFKITDFLDQKYGFNSSNYFKKDCSKYSYPILSIQKDNKQTDFNLYIKELINLGFDCTWYFHLYVLGLKMLGKRNCDYIIFIIKKILGKTPVL